MYERVLGNFPDRNLWMEFSVVKKFYKDDPPNADKSNKNCTVKADDKTEL